MSTKFQPTALISISYPLRKLYLALYLAFIQWHLNRQVSITAGNEAEKHAGELGIASGSELTVLVSRAHIYSDVVWSEQMGGPPRLGASSVLCMKKNPQHSGSLQGKNHVSGL